MRYSCSLLQHGKGVIVRVVLFLVGVLLLSVPVVEAGGWQTLRAKVRSVWGAKPARWQQFVAGAGMAALICLSSHCTATASVGVQLSGEKATVAAPEVNNSHLRIMRALVHLERKEGGDAILDPILRQWWDKHGGVGKLIRAALVVDDREPLAGLLVKLTEDELAAGIHAGLLAAVKTGQSRIVSHLDWLADLDALNAAMQLAEKQGYAEIREQLVSYRQREINAALTKATEHGDLDEVKNLLTQGARTTSVTWREALRADKLEVVKLLLTNGARADTGLLLAAENGSLKQVKLMLAHGAKNHYYAMQRATMGSHNKIVEHLLAHGTDPDAGMFHAAFTNNYQMVKLFLQHGADELDRALGAVNYYQQLGIQPSTLKNYVNSLLVIDLLLAKGADPNVGLRDAARANNYQMVKLFLQRGADDVDNALLIAINRFEPLTGMAIIDLLISKGAKAQEEDKVRLDKLRRIYQQQQQD